MIGSSPRLDLLIVGAVPPEVDPLKSWLSSAEQIETEWTPCWLGGFGRLKVGLASLGIGKVNAAAGSAFLIGRFRPTMVWIVGSAGAYALGPLKIGDVLVSSTVFLGDEGVWEKEGLRSMEAVGIPVAEERGRAVFERLVLEGDELFERLVRVTPPGLYVADSPSEHMPRALPYPETTGMLEGSGKLPPKPFRVLIGPSVTVSLSSGDEWVAKERFSRYHAWAEDMEGSALIQVCRRFGVSVAQCRGISNRAGVRDKSLWRMHEALAHCHAVVGSWLCAFHENP
ncbi:phosphorylase family protein [Desulfosoma sp.]